MITGAYPGAGIGCIVWPVAGVAPPWTTTVMLFPCWSYGRSLSQIHPIPLLFLYLGSYLLDLYRLQQKTQSTMMPMMNSSPKMSPMICPAPNSLDEEDFELEEEEVDGV